MQSATFMLKCSCGCLGNSVTNYRSLSVIHTGDLSAKRMALLQDNQ